MHQVSRIIPGLSTVNDRHFIALNLERRQRAPITSIRSNMQKARFFHVKRDISVSRTPVTFKKDGINVDKHCITQMKQEVLINVEPPVQNLIISPWFDLANKYPQSNHLCSPTCLLKVLCIKRCRTSTSFHMSTFFFIAYAMSARKSG